MRGLLIFTTTIYYIYHFSNDAYIPPRTYIFDDSSILVNLVYWDLNHGENTKYDAFQGFVLFDDWGDDCPLESISRINPYYFNDETQVISLQSKYPNSSRTHPCLWQFSAPKGFGFKFVIQELNLMDQVQLTISNSTNVIHT